MTTLEIFTVVSALRQAISIKGQVEDHRAQWTLQ